MILCLRNNIKINRLMKKNMNLLIIFGLICVLLAPEMVHLAAVMNQNDSRIIDVPPSDEPSSLKTETITLRQSNGTKPFLPSSKASLVIFEDREQQEEQVKEELESLKGFLNKNNGDAQGQGSWIPSWLFSPGLWSKRDIDVVEDSGTVDKRGIVDDTVQMVYNRLIDYGFKSVGVSDTCREQAICNTSNYILNQMPAFVQEYGKNRLMEFPSSVFGNNDYTNAWMVGLSTEDSSFCTGLFGCEPQEQLKLNLPPMDMQQIPIRFDTQSSYYLQPPIQINQSTNQNPFNSNSSVPFMVMVVPNNVPNVNH